MQHAEKNTFFRNVYLFIDRVKDFVMIKDYDTVKNNLYTCLRDITMIWYTVELFEKIKKLIKTKNNLNVWERYLMKRFRKRSTVTMITITRERYILENARRCRESREYVDIIIRAAKSTKLSFEAHLMMLIYNDLDVELQRNIVMSDLITNIHDFLQSLDDKKKIWWTLTRRNKFSYEEKKSYVNYTSKSNATYQSKFHDQFSIYYQSKFDQYEQQWNSEFFQREQFSYQYDVNQQYQSQSAFLNAKQLKASKFRLQIIDANQQSEFAFFSKSYSSRFDQKNNREEYNRRDSLKRAWSKKKTWNNQSRDDNYNRDRVQRTYVDATQKNVEDLNNAQYQKHHSDQNSDFVMNDVNKKNDDFYKSNLFDQESNEYNYFLNENEYHIETSLAVELGFGQKFKPDPRVGQIRQPNPRVEQPEPEETEPVTYSFLGFGQKSLPKPESWTEILVQPENWIGRVVRHVRNPTLRPRYICERDVART